MSGSAFSVSWIALVAAIAGYIIKRWWDNADSITEHRRKSYSVYFAATYDLMRELMHRIETPDCSEVRGAYEAFQKANPDFLLQASPRAIVISDELFNRFLRLRDADRSRWSDDEKRVLIEEVQQALGGLREQLKIELFSTQPRFLFERTRHKREWLRGLKRAESGTAKVDGTEL